VSSGAHSRSIGWVRRVFLPFSGGSFINFVDAIFTTLLEPLFTNAFDVIGTKQQIIACVAHATPINSLAT
jgi:hypothetical protein